MRSIDSLSQLEAAKHWRESKSGAKVVRLLNSLTRAKFNHATSLIRFHEALLFLRAFPHDATVMRKADELLEAVGGQVARLLDSGTNTIGDEFEPEAVSGIAGTTVTDTFTYEVADWLGSRHGDEVTADWDFDEQSRSLALSLPRFIPLLEDDALVEADTPYRKWITEAAGQPPDLLWLLERFRELPLSPADKTELYDAMHLAIKWNLANSKASRTLARRKVDKVFFHKEPLIRRNQVSLAEEFQSSQLEIRKLEAQEAQEILDMCRDAVTVRYRELYGTTRGDPNQLYECNPGRGVQIFLWGLPPDRRLPLRAYHAGFTLKNGIPINYIEGISLFEWMEIGFNTFYAYRDGETAWIYAQALHFLNQLTGVGCFSVYPYQLGHENEEAIQSGAFWFYRKLGFRPGRRELQKIVEKEEKKIAAISRHRTSAATLRKLAADHAFYEVAGQAPGRWDTFSIRNLGFAVQRLMAARYNGNAAQMRAATRGNLMRILDVNPNAWSPAERPAFENFGLIAALIPGMESWSAQEKHAVVEIIRAKAAPSEADYLRRLQEHPRLRLEIVLLGSSERSGQD